MIEEFNDKYSQLQNKFKALNTEMNDSEEERSSLDVSVDLSLDKTNKN